MDVQLFAALADPTRRRVLTRLADGPATATELAARFPVTRQAIVKHLGALAETRVVVKERRGREVRYRIERAPLDDAARWLVRLSERWETRLARLKRYVEEDER